MSQEVFEHLCLKKNAPQGIHNQLGLSNKREIATFYVSEKGGDSSIVEPPNYTDTIKINTISLNEYVFNYHISHIKLLKLEAEGFEPEILEGASEILHKIAFISIDGGFERGINQDETFSEINNKLLKSSFKMVSINFEWGRALFKNSNLITD